MTYQCRGEADRAFYDPGQHNAEFASDLESAYLDNLFRGTLYSNPLFFAIQIHGPNQAMQSVSKFFADTTTEDPRAGIRAGAAAESDQRPGRSAATSIRASSPRLCHARAGSVLRDRRGVSSWR